MHLIMFIFNNLINIIYTFMIKKMCLFLNVLMCMHEFTY